MMDDGKVKELGKFKWNPPREGTCYVSMRRIPHESLLRPHKEYQLIWTHDFVYNKTSEEMIFMASSRLRDLTTAFYV